MISQQVLRSQEVDAEAAADRVLEAIKTLNTPTRENMACLMALRHDEITVGLLRLSARNQIMWLGRQLGYGLRP